MMVSLRAVRHGGRVVASFHLLAAPGLVLSAVAAELGGERVDHRADDHLMRHVAALHRDVGLGIDGIALFHQLLHHFSPGRRRQATGRLSRRPTRLISTLRSALSQTETPRALMLARVLGVHIGAAAGREHLRAAVQQPRDHLALALAEIGLAVLGEDLADA